MVYGASSNQALGRSERRRRQHLALSQRLLDPLPEALRSRDHGADRFWSALRWGGLRHGAGAVAGAVGPWPRCSPIA